MTETLTIKPEDDYKEYRDRTDQVVNEYGGLVDLTAEHTNLNDEHHRYSPHLNEARKGEVETRLHEAVAQTHAAKIRQAEQVDVARTNFLANQAAYQEQAEVDARASGQEIIK